MYCNFELESNRKTNRPAFGQTYYNCNKGNHFQTVNKFFLNIDSIEDVYQVRTKKKETNSKIK